MNQLNWYNLGLSQNDPLIFTINTNLGTGASMTIPTKAGTKNYSVEWGDGTTSSGQTGNASHTYATHGAYQIKIKGVFLGFVFGGSGDRFKLTRIDNWGDVGYSESQTNAFLGCSNLNYLAEENQEKFFANLTNGTNMFAYCASLTSLPSGVTFVNLITGEAMLASCASLTSLPSGVTFANLTNGNAMLGNCTSLTSLPSGVTFANLTNGTNMLQGCTINTTRYSKLLNDMNTYNSNTSVNFHGGNSKYDSTAVSARANLISAKSWTITDGGL